MENGAISDGQLSASSYYSAQSGEYPASRARLYHERITHQTGGWAALTSDINQWLDVDFGTQYRVTGVATQGENAEDWSEWVTTYKLMYKNEGESYQFYMEPGQSTHKVE